MKYQFAIFVIAAALLAGANRVAQADPPFTCTICIDPDIITDKDRTSFISAPYAGQDMRLMYDRRANGYVEVNAFLFNATFDDGLAAEIQVNPEFGDSATAAVVANKYAAAIGRLPTISRKDVQKVWIHKGNDSFGGVLHALLIHTEQADSYEAAGILEEALAHSTLR